MDCYDARGNSAPRQAVLECILAYPLGTKLEESWEKVADEEANDACVVEHLDEVGDEQGDQDGQDGSQQLHGQTDEERTPRVVLAGVLPEDDHVHVIDHGKYH